MDWTTSSCEEVIVERLLTMQEVEERLRCSKTIVRRLINEEPEFKTVRLGRRRLISERALDAFIRSKERA